MRQPTYLVRHGQSEWNVLRRTQGQIAHPRLTERGRAEAESAAALIEADLGTWGGSVDRVISSDLTRALETAQILSARLGGSLSTDTRLRELGFGDLEGRSYEDTWAAVERLDTTDPETRIGGGESLQELAERMGAVLDETNTDEVRVLVSHGDSIRIAITLLEGRAVREAGWATVPNGAVARVTDEVHWLG